MKIQVILGILGILISIVAIFFVLNPSMQMTDSEVYRSQCISACMAMKSGSSLENGPCLLNPIENTNWVCDVAHEPRTETDNLPENQCSAFRSGTAKHFIEVNTDCELIRMS